jgi:glycosyltransferase involved in cell wall biosynthesis
MEPTNQSPNPAAPGRSTGALLVTACVPVYNGATFVAETLACLARQTVKDIRILISVDRSDDDSVGVCRSFERDPRFVIFAQQDRAGWVGNMNRLLARVETPFFFIMPHDDLIADTYVEKLLSVLSAHPHAACAYCGIELLYDGKAAQTLARPSLVGPRVDRLCAFLIEYMAAYELRGLVARHRIGGTVLLPTTDADDYAADTLWLLRLASRGELRALDEVLYRKKMLSTSETARWWATGRTPHSMERWVDHSARALAIALENIDAAAERDAIAEAAVRRFLMPPVLNGWRTFTESLSAQETAAMRRGFAERTGIALPCLECTMVKAAE